MVTPPAGAPARTPQRRQDHHGLRLPTHPPTPTARAPPSLHERGFLVGAARDVSSPASRGRWPGGSEGALTAPDGSIPYRRPTSQRSALLLHLLETAAWRGGRRSASPRGGRPEGGP